MRHDRECELGRLTYIDQGSCKCATRAWLRDPLPEVDFQDDPVEVVGEVPGWGYMPS